MDPKFYDYLYKFWVRNTEDLCSYCSNYIECKEEECSKYENFGGAGFILDSEGEQISTEFSYDTTCCDLDYGDCPMMENSPCKDCFENDMRGFIWNGVIPDNYKAL